MLSFLLLVCTSLQEPEVKPTYWHLDSKYPLAEEVQKSMPLIPNNSEYVDLNDDLQSAFLDEIYKPVAASFRGIKRFKDPLQSPIDPVVIDGVIATREEQDLFHQALLLFESQIKKSTIMEAGEQTRLLSIIVRAQLSFEQVCNKSYDCLTKPAGCPPAIQLSDVRSLRSIQLSDVKSFQSILLIINFFRKNVKLYEQVLLDYMGQEIYTALASGNNPEVLTLFPENLLPDLRDEIPFQNFVLEHNPALMEVLNDFSGTPVDFIPSQTEGSPTVLVFLDIHTSAPLKWSEVHDFALLRKLKPAYTIEGLTYFEKEASIENHKKNLESEINALTVFKNALGPEIKICEEIGNSSRLEFLLEEQDEVNRQLQKQQALLDLIKKTKSLDFTAMQSELKETMEYLEHLEQQIPALELAALTLYPNDMELRGYEDNGVQSFGRKEVDFELGSTDIFFNLATVSLRSKGALENTITMAETTPNNLGAMMIGGGHYASVRAHAEKIGDVNVIFIRPNPYDGPLPI